MKGMWARYVLFVVFSFAVLALNIYFNPPKPKAAAENHPAKEGGWQPHPEDGQGKPEAEAAAPAPDVLPSEQPELTEPAGPAQKPETPQAPEASGEPEVERELRVPPKPRLVTLGSLDPDSPYAGLATLTNLGAALVRFELNSPHFGDLEDRSGYVGHLGLDEIGHLAPAEMAARISLAGCPVDVVGPGTPAARAGLKPGDLITSVDGKAISGYSSLRRALKNTRPGQEVQVTVDRRGKPLSLSVTLGRRPLDVVRPEKDDPLSFLLTLRQVDGQVLDDLLKKDQQPEGHEDEDKKKKTRDDKQRDESIGLELAGLDLRTGAWDIEDEEQFDAPGPHSSVTFFRELPGLGLKISKTYRLAQVSAKEREDPGAKAYHLVFDVKIENVGPKAREVAYQLDGPTGLPTEGKWYSRKVGRGWGAVGLRDVVVSWERQVPSLVGCRKIADDDWGTVWRGQSLTYIGVDAQYFSAVLIPQKENPEDIWFAESQPLRVGAVDKNWKTTTNTSCRMTSQVHTLEPGGGTLEHEFTIFAGPKKPELLAKYNLQELVYYGWFSFVAKPMLWTLHVFYALVHNYGLAIIMLTVLVRSCMIPLSLKQQRGALKMQELQPEIKKIHEKYKNNAEAKVRAQQELFKKHNYHPLSGCLPVFLQFPVFIGLYRGLMVDVELRQAPLLTESIRWCSNLAAPDMLFDWSGFMPEFVTSGLGLFGLGPYFNLLPVLTIALFLIQQKMFMPTVDPADEQARVQRTMMKFMMIFMGLVFFKVASGLCLYFIASSLWGLAERKLLPKTSPPTGGHGSKASKQPPAKPSRPVPQQPKPRQAKRTQPKPGLFKMLGAGPNHDGAARRKKKKKKRSRGKR